MSSLQSTLSQYLADPSEVPGAAAEIICAPASLPDAAKVLEACSAAGASVVPWGSGSQQRVGGLVPADVILSTHRLNQIVDWQPDNMTVVVQGGVRAADLAERLAERHQTAVLAEIPGESTVGGLVATGASMYRRARYGPIRNRMLEATLATGDGRVVRGGGRVVKNVTGYDIPRLVAGSMGSLGLIGEVCLKLWPMGAAHATVRVDDPERAWATAYRPLAVLDINGSSFVYLGGTPAEVAGQSAQLGDVVSDQMLWPEPWIGSGDEVRLSMRVRPSDVADAVASLPSGWEYVAAYGVGEVSIGCPKVSLDELADLRRFAEARGGALVVLDGPTALYESFDPWGSPPSSLDLQRRIVARFDPDRIINRGRLPGGL